MKALLAIPVFLFFSSILNPSQAPDYGQGNGTIIKIQKNDTSIITIRRHKQRIQIGNFFNEKNVDVFDNPKLDKKIFELNIGENINTSELLKEEAIKEKKINIWLQITTDKKQVGWIYMGSTDPYENDNWSILEKINSNNKVWTVRKYENLLAVWEVLNVRDKPGIVGTTVLFKLIPKKDHPQLNIDTIALTEEEDTIKGTTDCWAKISYQGKVGWIFAGNATIERGGPKYFTPENMVRMRLGK